MNVPFSTNPHQANGWIEPGLLSLFRTVVGLQFGLSLIFAVLLHPFSPDEARPDSLVLFGLVWTGLLLAYLFADGLMRRLGRHYLPLALAFATGCALVEYVWELRAMIAFFGEQRLPLILGASGWRLLIGLLTPLVILASQYPLRVVALFVAAVALVEGAIFYWLYLQPLTRVPVFGLIAIHATIFALIGFVVNRAISAQREQRKALAAVNAQLAQHAATLEQLTVSRERNRLAREMHDTLAHTLSAVSVQLEAVDSAWESNPAKARELLGKSLAQTRSGLTETRRALQALRATPLDDLGLRLALRNLAESTAHRGGLALTLALDEGSEPFAPELEQQLYRIAQEAMTNVLKHAGARTLHVALSQHNGTWSLLVDDDGAGFDASAALANGHYGLQGMRERAELLGADFHVRSDPGRGTQIRLQWQENG